MFWFKKKNEGTKPALSELSEPPLEARIREIFQEKKKYQRNNDKCAAIIVDCDCDNCLWNEASRLAKREQNGKKR